MLSQESNESIKDLVRILNPDAIEKARVMAVNRVVRRLPTSLSRAARLRYNVKHQRIQSALRVRKAQRDQEDAMVAFLGPRIGLVNFAAKPKKITLKKKSKAGKRLKRTGVSVKILKTGPRKVVTSQPAFMAELNGHAQVMARKTKERDSIRVLTTLSVPEMITGSEGALEAINQIPEVFEKEFEQALKFLSLKDSNLK